jgi:excisionase family DNA binding protein
MAERRAIPVYLSLEESAECMSVSVKTIRRWIAAGTLPAYRCGKRAIRIKLEDLEAAPRQIPSARLSTGRLLDADRTGSPLSPSMR